MTTAQADAEAKRRWGEHGYAVDFGYRTPLTLGVGCYGKIGVHGSNVFGMAREGDWEGAFREADEFLGGRELQDNPRWTPEDTRRAREHMHGARMTPGLC